MQIKNQFDKESLKKVGKGVLIAGSSAVVIYLLQWGLTLDLGVYTPMATAIMAIIINAIKEYKKETY